VYVSRPVTRKTRARSRVPAPVEIAERLGLVGRAQVLHKRDVEARRIVEAWSLPRGVAYQAEQGERIPEPFRTRVTLSL